VSLEESRYDHTLFCAPHGITESIKEEIKAKRPAAFGHVLVAPMPKNRGPLFFLYVAL
jgi:hypothetical protein